MPRRIARPTIPTNGYEIDVRPPYTCERVMEALERLKTALRQPDLVLVFWCQRRQGRPTARTIVDERNFKSEVDWYLSQPEVYCLPEFRAVRDPRVRL